MNNGWLIIVHEITVLLESESMPDLYFICCTLKIRANDFLRDVLWPRVFFEVSHQW
jgi:hypothetical protein